MEGWTCPVCKRGVSPFQSFCPCVTAAPLPINPWPMRPAPWGPHPNTPWDPEPYRPTITWVESVTASGTTYREA